MDYQSAQNPNPGIPPVPNQTGGINPPLSNPWDSFTPNPVPATPPSPDVIPQDDNRPVLVTETVPPSPVMTPDANFQPSPFSPPSQPAFTPQTPSAPIANPWDVTTPPAPIPTPVPTPPPPPPAQPLNPPMPATNPFEVPSVSPSSLPPQENPMGASLNLPPVPMEPEPPKKSGGKILLTILLVLIILAVLGAIGIFAYQSFIKPPIINKNANTIKPPIQTTAQPLPTRFIEPTMIPTSAPEITPPASPSATPRI